MKRFLLLLVGCAQPPPAPAEFHAPEIYLPRGRDFVIARHVDAQRVPPAPDASGINVLYLNYDSVTISFNTDDARTNESEITGGNTVNVPPFALWPGAKVTLQQAKDAVTDRLRWFYKPWDVQVVTTRPVSGNYTMIAVGGKNTLIPGLTGAAGVSPLDCDNTNPNNVVYDFSDEQPPDYGGLPGIAITAAHESGHSYGLEHTDNPFDIMYSVASPNITIDDIFAAGFTTTGTYSSFNGGGEIASPCNRPTTMRNNQALLTTNVGNNPSPGDTQQPTIDLTFPLIGYVPTQFPIRVNASDNNKVSRVEVYKNLELIAVLNTAPYQAVVNAADNEAFYLTVEAIDPDANRKSVTKAFQALAATPSLCPNGQSDCKSTQTCKDGICRYPIGTPCTIVDQTASFSPQCEFSCKQPLGVSGTICTNTCNASRPCPAGNLCGADNLCAPGTAPMPKMVGEACLDGSECASTLCQGTCLAACDDANPCADGMMCAQVTGGMGCVPAMPMSQPSGGCSTVPAPTGIPLFFLVFIAWWVRRKAAV
jgi:Bacterial Ig domain